MGTYARTNSLSDGTTAYGSQVAAELDALGSSVNNIVNAQIAAGAAIADSKLAQITTPSKVSGAAITGLASLPSGAGVIPAANIPTASAAEVLAGTEAGKYVAPSTMVSHEGVVKAWCCFNGTGTPTMLDRYNMDASITDGGPGLYTVSMTTDFGSANYAASVMHLTTSAGNGQTNNVEAIAAGTLQVLTGDNSGSPVDPTYVSILCIGDR